MTFNEFIFKLEELTKLPNVTHSIVGYSTMGLPIYNFHLGSFSGKQIFLEGGIHAREYLSSLFLIKEVEYLSTQNIEDGGIYVVPCVNPDGVRLVLSQFEGLPCIKQKDILRLINNNNSNFDLWKANINGVDLNVNFDAWWGRGSQNVFCVAPENFVGYYPDSEREVNNLINVTKQINPSLTISWHTKGEVIYYGFDALAASEINRDRSIAEQFKKLNGYSVIKTTNSVGGYSDWVSLNFRVPAFTIELGGAGVSHPLTEENLELAFEQNKQVPLLALELT